MGKQEYLIKQRKYGLLFWFISCFLGSIVVVEIERHFINQTEVYNMPISDGVLLWFIMTVVGIIVSSPFILMIYLLSKKSDNLGRLILLILLIAFGILYFITQELSKNYFEAFYITSPYFVFAFIFEIILLKIDR